MGRKICYKCGRSYDGAYKDCLLCNASSINNAIADQKHTYASNNRVEGFIFGFSDGLMRGMAVFWIGVIMCLIGVSFVGIIFIACSLIIAVVMPFIGASNFRSGQCPYCKINIKGIIKDNGITCKACNNRVISINNTFSAI